MKKINNLIKNYIMSFKKSILAFLGITSLLSSSDNYGVSQSPTRPVRNAYPINKKLTPAQKKIKYDNWYKKRCERRGLKLFHFYGEDIYALNQRNAHRKAMNSNG